MRAAGMRRNAGRLPAPAGTIVVALAAKAVALAAIGVLLIGPARHPAPGQIATHVLGPAR